MPHLRALLRLARGIDALSERIGAAGAWLVLAAVAVSAVNAVVRKAFNMSSNAALEIQWYLFAAVFLLGAGYTLLRQGHVRIDVLLTRLPRRAQVAVEIFGLVAFLLPFAYAVISLAWPLMLGAMKSGEMSQNAGGLLRWPVYALVPLGFALLALQGISEIIKRLAFLAGQGEDPGKPMAEKTAEEELANFLAANHDQAQGAARSPVRPEPVVGLPQCNQGLRQAQPERGCGVSLNKERP